MYLNCNHWLDVLCSDGAEKAFNTRKRYLLFKSYTAHFLVDDTERLLSEYKWGVSTILIKRWSCPIEEIISHVSYAWILNRSR